MNYFPLISTFFIQIIFASAELSSERPKCEEITVPMCRGIGYNMTSMPNQFHHEKQDEAGMEAHQFRLWKFLTTCSVCERAHAGCAVIMLTYGFPWPESMDCNNFPVYPGAPEQLCMDQKNGETPGPSKILLHLERDNALVTVGRQLFRLIFKTIITKTSTMEELLTVLDPVRRTYFSPNKNNQNHPCLFGSLMVIFTYLTDCERFCYPERSIIFLPTTITCDSNKLLYAGFGTPTSECTIVFALIFFFSMPASFWWIILTFSWFLSASLKWTAINDYSVYFHMIAWGIPFIKTFLVIFMQAIDGEPLAGISFVGNLNFHLLMRFIIVTLYKCLVLSWELMMLNAASPSDIPILCSYLMVGIFFLLAGLISIVRIRRAISQQIRHFTDKFGLDKLMVRIIIFSILHIVPMVSVIICNYYQYSYGISNFFWILSAKTHRSWWHCISRTLCCCWHNTARLIEKKQSNKVDTIHSPLPLDILDQDTYKGRCLSGTVRFRKFYDQSIEMREKQMWRVTWTLDLRMATVGYGD
uniref:G-protein coupled receptors family 2 profile 2 domain-containing protein n=1 Tax=Tetranychus urticae TaxID=32264 RepID=T1KGS6_TETUR